MDTREDHVVLFATPTFDKTVSVDFHTSMLGTYSRLWQARIPCDSHLVAGNQWVDTARNQAVNYFLNAEVNFTDLIFIDSDQGWDPAVIERIIRAQPAVVGALPPKKSDPVTYHANGLTGVIEGHLFQSIEAGTGLMRIRREVFERLYKAHPDLAQLTKGPFPWAHTPYFQSGNTKYGRLGEDVFFCRLLREIGEYIWIDSDVTFTHCGQKRWKGNFYEHCINSGLLKSA